MKVIFFYLTILISSVFSHNIFAANNSSTSMVPTQITYQYSSSEIGGPTNRNFKGKTNLTADKWTFLISVLQESPEDESFLLLSKIDKVTPDKVNVKFLPVFVNKNLPPCSEQVITAPYGKLSHAEFQVDKKHIQIDVRPDKV